MKKLFTILSILISLSTIAQIYPKKGDKNYGLGFYPVMIVTSADTGIVIKGVILGTGLMDSTVNFYYSKDGKTWTPSYIHDANIPVGESYHYYYPKRKR